MQATRFFSAALLFILASSSVGSAYCPRVSSALLEPTAETLAGNGSPGIIDGAAKLASFVAPVGIAAGPDGSIYIADQLAHDVRRIHDGMVQTIAGTSPPGFSPQQREGGYVNGPASQARFNHPSGLAVAKDGTIYVADTWNRVIRKIQHGSVSTFAGSGAGSRDGAGTFAQFTSPQGIAIDDAGNLYVADSGVGIRKITPNAAVSTLPAVDDKNVCGVAAGGSGTNLHLAYTDDKGITLIAGPAHRYHPFTLDSEPQGEGHVIGAACAITILGDYSVAITDHVTNAVRFIRFRMDPPVGSGAMVRTLVGGAHEGNISIGGYQDGSSATALANVPSGIAYLGNDTLAFSDTGNRRIRIIKHVDARGPLPADLNGLTAPPHTYRVAVFGDSFAFHNVMWPESMAGQVEGGLLQKGPDIGLHSCPYVTAASFAGVGIADGIDLLTNYYTDGQADLVIFLMNTGTLAHDLEKHPAWKNDDAWKPALREKLAALGKLMTSAHAKFLLVPVPHGSEASPLESILGREDFSDAYARATVFENAMASSGVRTLKLLRALEKAEESPQRVPFYNLADPHPSADGSMWVGKKIFAELAAWQPWKAPH